MTASGGGGQRVEALSKKEKGLSDMENTVVMGGGGRRGLIGNVKKDNKD